jgi:hypothetical protein
MFGLIKLAAYGLLGYCIYEFFQGLMNGSESRSPRARHEMCEGVRSSVEQEIHSRSRPVAAQ